MRRLILSVTLLITSSISYSQANWVSKDVGNNIVVKFPNNPNYKLIGKAGTYTTKSESNLFTAIVQYDVIPNYQEFLKLSPNDQAKYIEIFLDNAIKGLLASSGNEGTPFKSIQLGNLNGRQVSYSAINPATGESSKRYCKLFYAYNKVYMFNCLSLNVTDQSDKEITAFLNSIYVD